MKRILLSVLVLLATASLSNACGPFRAFFQNLKARFSQPQCEPVQQPAQVGPVSAAPQQMPQFQWQAVPVTQPKFEWTLVPAQAAPVKTYRAVWKQVCNGGVCTLVPVTEEVQQAPEEDETSAWDF